MQKAMAGPTQPRPQFAFRPPIAQSRAFQRNISVVCTISAISGQWAIGHGATLVGHGATVATIVVGHGMMSVVVEFGRFVETTDRGALGIRKIIDHA